VTNVRDFVSQSFCEFKNDLAAVLAQRSISEGARGVHECAALLADLLSKRGFDEAEVVPTAGLPGVWGYLDARKRHTLAVYAMFDHAPITSVWKREPFEPVAEAFPPYERVMFGKGVFTKGPLVTFLWALWAMKQLGHDIPVNIALILDGEEFVGSTNYHHLVHERSNRLEDCIGAISPAAVQSSHGSVSISLGSKGCAYFELISDGAHSGKGPVTKSVHSSAQGVVHSPVWRLVEALSTLTKPGSAGLEVVIPGFYDDITRPQGRQLELLRQIAESNRGKDWRQVVPGVAGRGRVEVLADDLEGEELFVRALYYPTLNINGIRAGYIHEDSPLFTLPGRAVARLDMRFSPNQRGANLMAGLREHLDKAGYSDIQIRDMGTHDWALASLEDAIVDAARATYERYGYSVTVWPMRGSGAPLGVFCSELGVPALGGVGIGATGSDGSDEFMVLHGNDKVAGVPLAAQFFADYLAEVATKCSE